jgi:MrcB-like, N-terminal domain
MVERALGDTDDLRVKLSTGQGVRDGRYAEIPWIGVRRESITSTFQSGVYVVYLISANRKTITLSLMLGVTRTSGDDARRSPLLSNQGTIEAISSYWRSVLEIPPDFSQQRIALGGHTTRARQYESGFICGKTYYAEALPSETVLISDLRALVGIYRMIQRDALTEPSRAISTHPMLVLPAGRVRVGPQTMSLPDVEAARQSLERRSMGHEALVQAVARCARRSNLVCEYNLHVDLLIARRWIIEAKTIDGDEITQVRHALSQLLYYRWLYRETIPNPILVAVFDRPPTRRFDLARFLEASDVLVASSNGAGFDGSELALDDIPWLFQKR